MNTTLAPITRPLPLWHTLDADEKAATLRAMMNMGGGFVSRLAQAWSVADRTNSEALGRAFDDLVRRYGPGSSNYGA